MLFILHTSKAGKLTLYPNKTHTPRELLSDTSEIDIPTDKDGLLSFVQDLLDRIPTEELQETKSFPVTPEITKPNLSEQLAHFEDEWENFPLPRKLHFAALAVEEARDIIKPVKKES